MLDQEEQYMLKAARELLAAAPRETLVTKLLATRADMAKLERNIKEERANFVRLERTIDAATEALGLALDKRGPLLDLVNEARVKLEELRISKEIPF